MKCRLCGNAAMARGGKNLCQTHYRKQLRYKGEPQGLVDAGPTRDRIRELMADGMRLQRIAEVSGRNVDSLRGVRDGKGERVQASTEARVLAIKSAHQRSRLAEQSHLPVVGTRRRLQSLIAMGYGVKFLARRLRVSRQTVGLIITGQSTLVRASTERAVVELFDKLQMHFPADSAIARKSKKRAQSEGWVLPFLWGESSIDDPAASPIAPIRTARLTFPEKYVEMSEVGMPDRLIAQKMGIKYGSLEDSLRRYGMPISDTLRSLAVKERRGAA